jgi:hypothetical protein
MTMRFPKHLLSPICLLLSVAILTFSYPARAQLTGTDTAPGSSCAGFPGGATRLTADADLDGQIVTLICNGVTWEKVEFRDCTTVGDTPVWINGAWKCSSAFVPDAAPAAFSFTDQYDVAPSTPMSSNTVTITGIDVPVFVQVSGDGAPQLNIDGGGWVASGMIAAGQTLQLHTTSGAGSVESSTVTLSVGTSIATWTVTTLNTACAGPSIHGFCWYASAAAANCDATCASHGGCNATGLTFGNSSTANCRTILDAISLGAGAVSASYWGSAGCFYFAFFNQRSIDASGSTCAGSYSGGQRACACNT